MNQQKRSDTLSNDNPLGRLLNVYEENKNIDVDTLDLKLAEGILNETPRLTRNITLIQVISVVAAVARLVGYRYRDDPDVPGHHPVRHR